MAEAAAPDIDFVALLLGRECPPNHWWVGEAVARKCSSTELRARAALELLCPPMGESIGPPPYLPQLPAIIRIWIALLNDHQPFLDLGLQGMPPAFTALVFFRAARHAMADPKCPDLVPELHYGGQAAALLIRALEKSGVPLSARRLKLSPAEQAALKAQADAIRARVAATAPAVMEPPAPPKASKPARRQSSKTKKAPAIEGCEPMPGWFL
jgi:hypothetical protein